MSNLPKISIITVAFNSASTIKDTIESVLAQDYNNIEYIIIDGGSSDGTLDIIKKYESQIHYFISEPDTGIYDGMNKGIRVATGDIVGILNSDDFYPNRFDCTGWTCNEERHSYCRVCKRATRQGDGRAFSH
mgnify:CR=1 FL=1